MAGKTYIKSRSPEGSTHNLFVIINADDSEDVV